MLEQNAKMKISLVKWLFIKMFTWVITRLDYYKGTEIDNGVASLTLNCTDGSWCALLQRHLHEPMDVLYRRQLQSCWFKFFGFPKKEPTSCCHTWIISLLSGDVYSPLLPVFFEQLGYVCPCACFLFLLLLLFCLTAIPVQTPFRRNRVCFIESIFTASSLVRKTHAHSVE